MVKEKAIGVIIKAITFGLIVLASYTILGFFGIIQINIEYLYIIFIGMFAYVIRELLIRTPLRRWL